MGNGRFWSGCYGAQRPFPVTYPVDVRNCSTSCPGRFTSGKRFPCTRLVEGRVGGRAVMDVLEGRDEHLAHVGNRTTIRRKPNP
jgi:hypothetical protein